MLNYRFLWVFILGLSLNACGYTFQGSGTVLPADVRKIYIPLVENRTVEAGLATTFTEALRDRFERFGVVTVVDSVNEADAELRTKILKLKRATGTVTSNTDTALQYDTTLLIAGELRRVDGTVLWRNLNLNVTRSFGVSSSVVVASSPDFAGSGLGSGDLLALEQTGTREVARGQEREALNQLSEQAAKIIYDSAVAPDF